MNVLPIKIFVNSASTNKKPTFKQASPNIYNCIPVEDDFVRNTGSLDIGRLKNLGISHFRLIDSNSVRGVTLANQKQSLLTELKECGIKVIF